MSTDNVYNSYLSLGLIKKKLEVFFSIFLCLVPGDVGLMRLKVAYPLKILTAKHFEAAFRSDLLRKFSVEHNHLYVYE